MHDILSYFHIRQDKSKYRNYLAGLNRKEIVQNYNLLSKMNLYDEKASGNLINGDCLACLTLFCL